MILKFRTYTKEEIEQADGYIKHERDENIAYVGMEQFPESTCTNRATGIVYETSGSIHDDCTNIV